MNESNKAILVEKTNESPLQSDTDEDAEITINSLITKALEKASKGKVATAQGCPNIPNMIEDPLLSAGNGATAMSPAICNSVAVTNQNMSANIKAQSVNEDARKQSYADILNNHKNKNKEWN